MALQRKYRGRANDWAGQLGLRLWLGRLSEGVRQLRSKRREVGFGYTVKLVWLWLVPRSLFGFDHYHIYGLDLRGWTGCDGDFGEVRWARLDDFEGFLRTGMGPDQTKELSEESYRAAVIEREGRIVAYNWCHTGTDTPWPWMRLSLGPGDVWSFRGWTAPELRGQGLFPRVKGFMARSYTDQGFTRMVSMIEALNRNQQKANAHLGGRPIGRLFTLRILRLTLVRFNGTLRVGWWSATHPFILAIDCVGRVPCDPERPGSSR